MHYDNQNQHACKSSCTTSVDDRIPLVKAFFDNGRSVIVECPYCHAPHYHGTRPDARERLLATGTYKLGHCLAHCYFRPTDEHGQWLGRRGYDVVLIGFMTPALKKQAERNHRAMHKAMRRYERELVLAEKAREKRVREELRSAW